MKQIAILGPGTVGGGVAEILTKNADTVAASAGEEIGLKYAVARRAMPDCPCTDKIVQDFDVVERDPEVWLVVETIGGCGAALDMVRRSLQAGKHVVTANKQLIAEHGVELFEIAQENGVNLLFEASVGGGIPVLNPLTRCFGANHITSVSGILNGTTNYILTQMLENGESYDAALRAAQEKGYAEADPTADVKGIDAARKTCILAGLAFGKNVDPADIHVEGITKVTAADAAFAAAGGMKIKLLGRAMRQDGKLYCFVSPHFVPAGKILAAAGGVAAAVEEVLRRTQPDMEIKIQRADGLRECRRLLTLAKEGKLDGFLLEGMACPGGCVAGAGTIIPAEAAKKQLDVHVRQAEVFSRAESPYRAFAGLLEEPAAREETKR